MPLKHEFGEPLLGGDATPRSKRQNCKTKIFNKDVEILFRQKSSSTSACFTKLKNVSRLHLLFVFAILALFYLSYNSLKMNRFKKINYQLFNLTSKNLHEPEGYLIFTETCKLEDWPVFDAETVPIFENVSLQHDLCKKGEADLQIVRTNNTWIAISVRGRKDLDGWKCWARELVRNKNNDRWDYGPDGWVGPLGKLYNFDSEVMSERTNRPQQTWDSVEVFCNKSRLILYPYEHYYSVLLIQKYYPQQISATSSETPRNFNQTKKTNVLLLGVDSISRLNFLRHFIRTKAFIDEKDFIPLLGYHKVGENSFPNIFPMLTGHKVDEYWNDNRSSDFRFDSTPLIFYDFNKNGYLTAFIEDMADFGFFTYGKPGFYEQPTHYYARPFNFAIHKSLYSSYWCYFRQLECEVYYDYIIDLLRAFRERGDQPHFIFNQISSLTHDYINHAGYADRPYSSLQEQIFAEDFHKNTIIFLYSDHGLRFGQILRTQSGIYEQRLPFFYMYIPDELTIDGKNAETLRDMVRVNQRRLTSHIDLHATMMHIIYGHEPEGEPYGRSLFSEIPLNRTCKEAGILDHYCMCSTYIRRELEKEHDRISEELVGQINEIMVSHRNSCIELQFNKTLSISTPQYEIGPKKDHHYLVQFETQPNQGIYESTVLVSGDIHDKKATLSIKVVGEISRIDKYGHQTKCVLGLNKIERFCYCRDLLPTTMGMTTSPGQMSLKPTRS